MIHRDSFISSLDNISDVSAHCAFIDRLAKEGDILTMRAIFADLLHEGPGDRIPDWAWGALLERIVEALALTDGYDSAVAALELVELANGMPGKSALLRLPAVVSKIVAVHPPHVIDALLLNVRDLETKALILQEAVVRNKLVAESSVHLGVLEHLLGVKHPLAALPLTLFDFENAVRLPTYRTGFSGVDIPFGFLGAGVDLISVSSPAELEVGETTHVERAQLVSAAVMNWKEDSNGKIEARTFRVAVPDYEMLPIIIPSLGLESVGVNDELRTSVDAALKDVFALLFSAASSGGAYNGGRYAAYGRLLAWSSLAGLVGAPVAAGIPDVANAAQSCRWCAFHSSSPWYYQTAWDLGIACYNPRNREVAILAASDTD